MGDSARDIHLWELPDFGAGAPAPEPEDPLPAQPTVREIEAIEHQAREEGRAAGLAQGLAEGRARAQKELTERVAQLDALFAAAAHPFESLDAQALDQLVQLTTVIARRVVLHELHTTPELVARIVQEAARALPAAARELRIYLHPDDLALLRGLGEIDAHWQCVVDPSLQRGGCRLEAGRSRLDAQVETRLAAVIDAVLGEDAADAAATPTDGESAP